MSHLTVYLKGGFGNQLFQIIACKHIAEYSNMIPFYYDLDIANDKYKRGLAVAEIAELFNIKKNTNLKDHLYFDEEDLMHPAFYNYDSPLRSINSENILIEGYFQNYRTFDPKIIKPVKKLLQDRFYEMGLPKHSYISLHIRELHGMGRGEKIFQFDSLNSNYYKKALDRIIQEKSGLATNPKLVIFMDLWKDPAQSKILPKIYSFASEFNLEVVLGDQICKSPLEIVSFMSQSHYLITANSSLSWFGGYFNNGKVYSPIMSLWEPSLPVPDSWTQLYEGNFEPKTHSGINTYTTFCKELLFFRDLRPFAKKIFLATRRMVVRKYILKIRSKYQKIFRLFSNQFLNTLAFLR